MKKITVYKLLDGSTHETKERAERHLTNILCKGVCLEVFESLADKRKMSDIQDYFVKNSDKIEQTKQIVQELKEVLSEKY